MLPVEAGTEMVKHQTHIVEDEMSAAAKKVVPGNTDVSIYEITWRCALSGGRGAGNEGIGKQGIDLYLHPVQPGCRQPPHKWAVPAYKISSGEM